MIAFHPTISLRAFLKALMTPCDAQKLHKKLGALFPDHTITLTDSGRSALALAIEALGLTGKTIAMPAYLCDVLLPVLERYRITPLFLDIDERTYQPPLSAYTPDVLRAVDAALLVATYGGTIPSEVIALLKQSGRGVIEDFAHRPLPTEPEDVAGDARFYSLHKTLPVPEGGLAVLPPPAKRQLPSGTASRTLVKNALKLLPYVAPLLASLRRMLRSGGFNLETWRGPRQPHALSLRFLAAALIYAKMNPARVVFSYCVPFRMRNPERAERLLQRDGISAERIWLRPIIRHPAVYKHYGAKPEDFPHTTSATQEVVCAPLWHITSDANYKDYIKRLEYILAGERACRRVE